MNNFQIEKSPLEILDRHRHLQMASQAIIVRIMADHTILPSNRDHSLDRLSIRGQERAAIKRLWNVKREAKPKKRHCNVGSSY